MSAISPPVFIQAGSHPAASVRQAFKGLLGQRGGLMHPNHLLVSANGTPNMSVNVAEGQVAIPGTENTYQGIYLCEAQGTTNLAIGAAAANPRYDLVVARIRDAAYATGPSSTFTLEVVAGTPAASPTVPTAPANSWVLAEVYVGASVPSITAPNITDRRTTRTGQYGLAGPAGHRVICTSGTRPPSPWTGMEIFETDTSRSYIWTGVGWVIPYPLGRLATTTRNSPTSSFSAIVYPNSLTFTALPSRRLRIRAHAIVSGPTVGTSVSIGIANGAGSILNQAYRSISVANAGEQITVEYETTSGAGGSLTFQISAFTSGGTAVITGSATALTYLTAFDEGPS